MRLPVVVGFGGVNAAGRSSSHHAFQRVVYDHLSLNQKQVVTQSLAQLMGVAHASYSAAQQEQHVLSNTLVRGIEKAMFDSRQVYMHRRVQAVGGVGHDALSFCMRASDVPADVPPEWDLSPVSGDAAMVNVRMKESARFFLPATRELSSRVAGQLPSGLKIDGMYNSRNHPRGLQMALFAMSDALGNLGIDWDTLARMVPPDQMSVYAGSAVGQMDMFGNGGLIRSRLLGKRPSSKHLALGLADMPANFINSYVLGNLGSTGNMMGACATFLYNLKQGVQDIQSGRARIVVVGASEAPITPEIIEGFTTMGALITDQGIRDVNNGVLDYRTACRPFGENKGFVLGESAQYIVLMDDELAMQVGAQIHAAIPSVFVNADAYKKSIPSPGVGNYVTMAKSVASVKAMLGQQGIDDSFLIAHATGTPQNRVTEAQIFSSVAQSQGIKQWPILAPKAYLGHSVAAAAGDQLIMAMGAWQHGLLPGIHSVDKIAEDVPKQNLDFVLKTREFDAQQLKVAFINSKGFGGNNATAAVLSPFLTETMLIKKHGRKAFSTYSERRQSVKDMSEKHAQECIDGRFKLRYLFDHNVLTSDDVTCEKEKLKFAFNNIEIDLNMENIYPEMC